VDANEALAVDLVARAARISCCATPVVERLGAFDDRSDELEIISRFDGIDPPCAPASNTAPMSELSAVPHAAGPREEAR
jgi:hypothetical protein